MPITELETDYLIIGGGAMGVAFADEVLARDKTARIIIVDRHARAGGHWNDAYSFVTLHQPAAFYGVNSENLGPGGAALVSGTEVIAYFERVLEKLEGTGRLQFFPLCESTGGSCFHSLVESNNEYKVEVKRKTVNATYMKVEVPSIRPPVYEVADDIELIPPNGLSGRREPSSGYVIIGAGKTGIDSVLFLLDQGVDPDRIEWIMPNDAWLLNRALISPGNLAEFASQASYFAEAETIDDLFSQLEEAGNVLRLDRNIRPENYRCATVSVEEFQQLKGIRNVIRMGRVVRIESESVVLEEGSIPTDRSRLHVDCTANGLATRPVRPVFDGNEITLQSVSMCQQVFSASLIAYVEIQYQEDDAMNALCQPVPHPELARDFLLASKITNENSERWLAAFPRWLLRSRLSLFHHDSTWKFFLVAFRMRKFMAPSRKNLARLLRQEFSDSDRIGNEQ